MSFTSRCPALPLPAATKERAATDDPIADLIMPFAGAMKMARKVGSTLTEKGVGQ
jgi:hypothetical protein